MIILLKPYIEIPIQYKEQLVNTDRQCCGRIWHESYRFCPSCLKELQTIDTKNTIKLDCNDLFGNDRLMHFFNDTKQLMYLFSNIYNTTSIDVDKYVLTELSTDLIERMIKEFEHLHYTEIQKVKELIGKEVEVKFGFLNLGF